jgi:hypothetical protein
MIKVYGLRFHSSIHSSEPFLLVKLYLADWTTISHAMPTRLLCRLHSLWPRLFRRTIYFASGFVSTWQTFFIADILIVNSEPWLTLIDWSSGKNMKNLFSNILKVYIHLGCATCRKVRYVTLLLDFCIIERSDVAQASAGVSKPILSPSLLFTLSPSSGICHRVRSFATLIIMSDLTILINSYRLRCETYAELHDRSYHVTLTYAAVDGVCDFLVAVILCWLLHNKRTEHQR